MPRTLLVSNLTNIRYLSGVQVTAGLMRVDGRRKTLFVDGRYTENAQSEVRAGVRVRPIAELDDALRNVRAIAFEAEDVSVARLARWKRKYRSTKFIPREGIVEKLRRKKKPEELRCIRKACKITDRVMRAIPSIMSVGARPYTRVDLTERDLAWHIERLAHDLGAEAMAFETIVAFGEHTSRPHHRPTNRKLRKGDLVQIDMGVKMEGYCSDCSRVFFTTEPAEEQRTVYELLRAIVGETTKMAKAGAKNTELDRYARKRLKEHGYEKYFLHSLGHGVGLEIHEGTTLSSVGARHAVPLHHNEVITIEPGVYLEGRWGMRIEDTVLVEQREGRPLTRSPKTLTNRCMQVR